MPATSGRAHMPLSSSVTSLGGGIEEATRRTAETNPATVRAAPRADMRRRLTATPRYAATPITGTRSTVVLRGPYSGRPVPPVGRWTRSVVNHRTAATAYQVLAARVRAPDRGPAGERADRGKAECHRRRERGHPDGQERLGPARVAHQLQQTVAEGDPGERDGPDAASRSARRVGVLRAIPPGRGAAPRPAWPRARAPRPRGRTGRQSTRRGQNRTQGLYRSEVGKP